MLEFNLINYNLPLTPCRLFAAHHIKEKYLFLLRKQRHEKREPRKKVII